MNKKFSTLVASLLLTSAFSVYSVDAKPMLATPTQVETRAVSEDVEETVELAAGQTLPTLNWLNLGTPENSAALQTKVFSGFTDNSRLAYVGQINLPYNSTQAAYFLMGRTGTAQTTTVANYAIGAPNESDFYWTLINGTLINNSDRHLSIAGLSDNYEIVPVKEKGAVETSQYFAIARRDNQGLIQYVTVGSGNVLEFTTAADDYTSQIANAALFVSVETAFLHQIAGDDMNDELGDGFELTISSKDNTSDILNADVFSGKLTAVEVAGVTNDPTKYYQIKNGNKLIVFDSNASVTSDGWSHKGQFKLIDGAAGAGQYSYFNISKADNGSEDIIVNILSDETPTSYVYRLYIAHTASSYALTISRTNPIAENWADVKLGGDSYVDLKWFLQGKFVTVDFVSAKDADNNDKYKEGGRLAILNNDVDYVAADGLFEKAPEAQWAVSAVRNTSTLAIEGIKLTNRENPTKSITINQIRYVRDKANTYEIVGNITGTNIEDGEQVKIQFVEEHSKNDGYAVLNANDLRNETYYLGQVRQAEGEAEINVYWAENHAASHQIGATVEQANATKWNLAILNKNVSRHENEADSVLVISELQEWVAENSRIETKKDTLVILPYVFQNRSNSEYVVYDNSTNLNYYVCDETNKDKPYDAQAFALKMKADNTYNYVVLKDNTYKGKDNATVVPYDNSAMASTKVHQENSTYYGTWRNTDMYAYDANSLMFVTKVDAPEYRKLVTTANLDTIKLYRANNEAQVVYEKKDPKSIVEGDTLSFLNIDNDAQFTTINPALYADTAYVNRGDNTCWQYLLGVNIEHKEGYYCPEHGFGETEPCTHAVWVSYNKGRYLMNMIDTANVYGKTAGIHNNPYINETEEGLTCAKLSFVDAIHVLTDEVNPAMSDKLYVINNGDTTAVDLGTPDFNTVKFAFKYTDSMESDEFKIQTQWKEYDPTTYGTGAYNNNGANFSQEGYLRWVNGCIVVDNGYEKGDVFNMNEDETRTPTANEEISAEGATVSVVATDGAVIVKGAEGKNVIVSTILGKVVANEVVNSDNETIAAPAGIVVVSVDGESFKVAVK